MVGVLVSASAFFFYSFDSDVNVGVYLFRFKLPIQEAPFFVSNPFTNINKCNLITLQSASGLHTLVRSTSYIN